MNDVTPLSEKKMELHYQQLSRGGTANNTICCVLADIWKHTDDSRVRLQCRRAAKMAKRMSKKLQYYKSTVNNNVNSV